MLVNLITDWGLDRINLHLLDLKEDFKHSCCICMYRDILES